jgi:hypothetical protein
LPERIGSLFIAAAEKPRNRNGLQGVRLQNVIGSGEVAK